MVKVENCDRCDEYTGNAGIWEDSIYLIGNINESVNNFSVVKGKIYGPYCDSCAEYLIERGIMVSQE